MRRNYLALLLSVVLVLCLAACGSKGGDETTTAEQGTNAPTASGIEREGMPKVIRWGSASTGSAGYVIITAFSDIISKYVTDFRSSSMSTSGGAENIRLMGS